MGKAFVHPIFDYLLIGGGLSLIVTPAILALPDKTSSFTLEMIPWLILVSNSAHFAASTVRLYTKPGTREALPFLTMAFPLVAIVVLSVCIFFADHTGKLLQALYLTWSPYHYAAQAYGLAVMYAFRSGCQLTASQKNMLWWIAVIPFVRLLIQTTDEEFLWWFLPSTSTIYTSAWSIPVKLIATVLGGIAVALPFVLYISVWRSKTGTMPLISLLVVLSNGIWFTAFNYFDGFVWATVFHGVQYLCIAAIFHVKEQMQRPENRRTPMFHVCYFYAASLLLGYGLFNCWPQAYMLFGFGPVESVLLVAAVVNIHHFIVDAYVWRLKPGDSNRQVVATVAA